MLDNVAAVVAPGFGSFGLGVFCEVFGYDRSADGLPRHDFALCTYEPGVVRSDTGLPLLVEHDLSRLAAADLVVMVGWNRSEPPTPELLQALRDAVGRGATVLGHCTGAFVLAEAGLLDGQKATTHWMYAAELAARYPSVDVDPNVLYVDAGQVITSAGTAAGIDTALYLIRREYGSRVANDIARRMVVPPHRDGGQAQYVQTPVPEAEDDSRLADVLAWATEHLDQPLTVEQLAAQALTSPRSFARHFRAATGTTPHAWLLRQRIVLARQLLEDTDLGIDELAHRTGFGSAATLRHHFARRVGTSPQAYRRTFRTGDAGSRPDDEPLAS